MLIRSSGSEDPAPAASRGPVLELRSAAVCYRRRRGLLRRSSRFWALEDVSLRVERGETLGVIGRNGAGKSTLLRLLAGIIRPDRGTVVVGRDCRATLLSLQAGFVPHLSGRRNAVLSGLLMGLSRREIERRLPEIVEFAELGEFIDEPLDTYSSGMRARLGFATAFHIDPEVLLIDEVLGVGDAAFVQKSKAAMRERIRSDKTVVLVSHSAGAIRSLCSRVVWIERGRVAGEGAVDEVLDDYLAGTRGR